MEILSTLFAILTAAFTMAMTIVMLLTFRKPRKLSIGSTILSLLMAGFTPLLYVLISGVRVNLAISAPLLFLGILLGFARGQSAEIIDKDDTTYTRASLAALLGWGASLALAPLLGMLQTSWLAALGLLPIALSTGIQLGMQGNLLLRLLGRSLLGKAPWVENVIGVGGSAFALMVLGISLFMGAKVTLTSLNPQVVAAASPGTSNPVLTPDAPAASAELPQPTATRPPEPRLIPENGLVITLRASWGFLTEAPNDLYLVDPGAWQVSQLNTTPIYSLTVPSISPDGVHIAFPSEQTGTRALYLAKVDGGESRPITQSGGDPCGWSKDGSHLYYTIKAGQGYDLIQTSIPSLDQVILHHFTDSPASLTFSPNEDRVLYAIELDDFTEAHVLNLASGEDRVLKSEEAIFTFAWAPDGSKFSMILDSYGDSPNSVHIFQADGSGEQLVDQGYYYGIDSSWSPDSQRYAYMRDIDFVQEISILNADGSNRTTIADPSGSFGGPHWSPDGAWIAFHAVRGWLETTGWDVFITRPDGSEERQLTQKLGTDEMYIFELTWVP